MTKLLYTKADIIEKSSIIAGLVAEVNLVGGKSYGQGLYLHQSATDINISLPLAMTPLFRIALVNDLFMSYITFDQAIEKLTNFKWSDIDGN